MWRRNPNPQASIATKVRPGFLLAAFVVEEVGEKGFLGELAAGDGQWDEDFDDHPLEGLAVHRGWRWMVAPIGEFELDHGTSFTR